MVASDSSTQTDVLRRRRGSRRASPGGATTSPPLTYGQVTLLRRGAGATQAEPDTAAATETPLDMAKVLQRKLRASDEIPELNSKYTSIRDSKIRPSKDFMLKGAQIVEGFIRDQGRIVYGGSACRLALQNSTGVNQEVMLRAFDPTSFPDWDFYTPTPVLDAIAICKLLHRAGFQPHVERAIHVSTFKIKANFYSNELADVTYLPRGFMERIMAMTDANTGLRYTPPDFTVVNIYKMFINPMTAWHKIEKQYLRASLLEQSFLLPRVPPDSSKGYSPTPDETCLVQAVLGAVAGLSNVMVVGELACNEYLRHCGADVLEKHGQTVRTVQLVVQERHSKDLQMRLDSLLGVTKPPPGFEGSQQPLQLANGASFSRVECYSFLEFFQSSTRWYQQSWLRPAVELLVSDICLPFVPVQPPGVQAQVLFGSYHVILYSLYTQYWFHHFQSIPTEKQRARERIDTLQYVREAWLQEHDKMGTEDALNMLAELQGDCMGDNIMSPLEIMRTSRLARHVWNPGMPSEPKEPHYDIVSGALVQQRRR